MEPNKEFTRTDSLGQKSLRVHVDNTFRGHKTKSEHDKEQDEARSRHAMFTEQHQAIMDQNKMIARSHLYTVLAAWAAVVAALATCVIAYLSLTESIETRSPNKPEPSIQQTKLTDASTTDLTSRVTQ